MPILLKIKKMLEDNLKVIRGKIKKTKGVINLHSYVEPTEEGIKLFGLWGTVYTLDIKAQIYVYVEPSGIIRSGFTAKFYKKYSEYFTRVTYKIPPNGN